MIYFPVFVCDMRYDGTFVNNVVEIVCTSHQSVIEWFDSIDSNRFGSEYGFTRYAPSKYRTIPTCRNFLKRMNYILIDEVHEVYRPIADWVYNSADPGTLEIWFHQDWKTERINAIEWLSPIRDEVEQRVKETNLHDAALYYENKAHEQGITLLGTLGAVYVIANRLR